MEGFELSTKHQYLLFFLIIWNILFILLHSCSFRSAKNRLQNVLTSDKKRKKRREEGRKTHTIANTILL